jgi:hypothetical protein
MNEWMNEWMKEGIEIVYHYDYGLLQNDAMSE